MNIMYSSNDRYVPIVGVSIISLLENNKDAETLKIYFIDCGLLEASRALLTSIVGKYHREIEFILLDDLIAEDALKVPNKSYYGRLFGTTVTCDDKMLYLDCDLIINGSLQPLYNLEMQDAWVAGVQGPGASYECRQRIGFPQDKQYLNTGVLLINLAAWRKDQVTEKLVNYLNEHGEIPPYHDQNIINALCYDHMIVVDPKYNLLWSMICCKPKHICKLNHLEVYYSEKEIENAMKNPVIIHFSNSIYGRPWHSGCKHPNKALYEKYKALSPWAKEPLPERKLSGIRKLRNVVYRNVPSGVYYGLQKTERYMVEHVIPKLPMRKLNGFLSGYMNGD